MSEIEIIYNDSVNETLAEGVYGARLGRDLGRLWLDFYIDRIDTINQKRRRVIVSRVALDPNGILELIKILNKIDISISELKKNNFEGCHR